MDIVYREMKEKVLDEITVMVNEGGESNDEGGKREPTREERFKLRTTAARNVYDRMTADEKAAIQQKVDKQRVDISPIDVQRK